MRIQRLITLAALATPLTLGACTRTEAPAPQVEKTAGMQPASESVTRTGCLRSGMLADATYVLTSPASTPGATGSTTFQLVGGDAATLRDNAGRQVEVTGTVDAVQHTASSTPPAPQDRAVGTTGTPSVETRTDIEVKRLNVSSIKPLNDRCE